MQQIKDAADVRSYRTYVVTIKMKQFQAADTLTLDETNIIKMFVRSAVSQQKDSHTLYLNTMGQVMNKIHDGKSITLRLDGVKLKRVNEALSRYIRDRRRQAAPFENRVALIVKQEEDTE